MVEYRDYGHFQGDSDVQVPVQPRRGQVYLATHDGAGLYLPHMRRSFISFSFGDKNIEDFNLIVATEGNFLQRNLYANFNDNITESTVWDGQVYWSSHFTTNNIHFSLATDGMTENQLNEFQQYFMPGKIDELVLSEHPNRAIMARISETPILNVIPFEEPVIVKIAGMEHETSTTLYKGRISLSFVMDDPFWYSRINILDKKTEQGYESSYWVDANKQTSFIIKDQDALKVILEDRVPYSMMLRSLDEDINTPQIGMLFGTETPVTLDLSMSATGSRIQGAQVNYGHVAYVLLNSNAQINIGPNSYAYCYYAGNAPCRPKITFSITPNLYNGYIRIPNNNYATNGNNNYNKIILQGKQSYELHFTTPSLWTGYNQVMRIFNSFNIGAAWAEIREAIRDNVKHWAPRVYANYVINTNISTQKVQSGQLSTCMSAMRDFIKDTVSGDIFAAVFTFDCETGEATGDMWCRDSNNQNLRLQENVGDMIKSNQLILKETNIPNADGYIMKWTTEHPEYSHRINADCSLSNFNINYRYKYL